jgi:hypothetical protein
MTEIYSSADRVLIYLGEQTEHTPEAIKLLDKFYTPMTKPQPNYPQTNMQWIQENNLPSVEEPQAWELLKIFFRHAWFRRKWTI